MSLLRDLLPRKTAADSSAIRQSDQLVEGARCLIEEGRPDEALESLRQARQLTPMRADIRQLAERAIDLRTRRLLSPAARKGGGTAAAHELPGAERGAALPGLSVPTEPIERAPARTRPARASATPARATAAPSASGRVAAAQPRTPSARPAPRREPLPAREVDADFDPEDQESIEEGEPSQSRPAISRRGSTPPAPSRGLDERRLPRLNMLGWLAVVGVAGIVMIGSSAILTTGANTLYENSRGDAEAEAGVPEGVREQLNEAKRELAAGEPLRAVARLQLAVERWPDQKKVFEPTMAEAYRSRGMALRADKSYERSAEAYNSAASLSPTDASLRVAQAECLYLAARTAHDRKETTSSKKLYAASVTAFEQALAVRPHDAAANLGKAKVHAARDERKEAVACYKDVITHHADSPEAVEAERMLKMLTGK